MSNIGNELTETINNAANSILNNFKDQLEKSGAQITDSVNHFLKAKSALIARATVDFAKDKDEVKYTRTMDYLQVSGLSEISSNAIDVEAAAREQMRIAYSTAISTALTIAKILLPLLHVI